MYGVIALILLVVVVLFVQQNRPVDGSRPLPGDYDGPPPRMRGEVEPETNP